jgi:ubiquinone/menaquinone biosynthesis C-methylase UbiE
MMADICNHVYGIDIVLHNIEQAKHNKSIKNYSNVTFMHYNGEKIPLDTESCDYIILPDVFEHFEVNDRDMYLQEMKRILKPNGTIIIITPDKKMIAYRERFDNFFHKLI